ncbi:MAG: NBR1-Ig-like domain-containing protein [Candidatus Promineifilaceae bacterium]
MLQKRILFVCLFTVGWLLAGCAVFDNVAGNIVLPTSEAAPTVIPVVHSEPTPGDQPVSEDMESSSADGSGQVDHKGIGLTYDPALFSEVTIEDVAATADQGLFGQPTPGYTWIGFVGESGQNEAANHWMQFREPQIIVFNRNDFGSFALGDGMAREKIGAFEQLLAERPSSFDGEVPILPLINAVQTIQAQVRWLDFTGRSGMRFITSFTQEVAPIANDRLVYIYYGLTDDGQYGVTALFPLAASSLPDTMPSLSDQEMATFNENYDVEMTAVTEQLNDLSDGDFSPQLSQLDALVQSLTVAPTPLNLRVLADGPRNAQLTTDSIVISSPGGGASLDVLAVGDAVVVNGSSSDGLYRRILCADGATGNCWLPGDVLQLIDTGDMALSTPIPLVDGQVVQVQALVENVVFAAPDEKGAFLGSLRVGEVAELVGTDAGGDWLNIVCPRHIGVNCWVISDPDVNKPVGFFSTGNPATATASPIPAATIVPATAAPTAAATVVPATRTPTATPIPVPPTATAFVCTNSAALIADVTVPDSTEFAPNTGFNKTWRIKNTGTCTWDGRYRLIHHGGSMLGAITKSLPLPARTAPGQTIDITLSLVSPAVSGTYQSDWMLQDPLGRPFGVGRSSSPFWVKIVVPEESATIISGVVYQDANEDGIYNNGEILMGSREVRLFAGPACQVAAQAIATAYSDGSGRYTFEGLYEGSFCVGLPGTNGLDDVYGIAIAAGQAMRDINLRYPVPAGSISGFVWDDVCLVDKNGEPVDGNCVPDGSGGYRADGMIEPNEGYIAGVTVLLRLGSCAADNTVPVFAVTDAGGRYAFNGLQVDTFCVYVDAASPQNASQLLPGDWTFPANGIWYQEITLLGLDQAYPVNFGWDYQLR